MSANSAPPIDRINVSACKIPTDASESDGTLAWIAPTPVLVEAQAAATTDIDYSYADTATATLVRDTLIEVVCVAARRWPCPAIDLSRSGIGLELKHADAQRYAV